MYKTAKNFFIIIIIIIVKSTTVIENKNKIISGYASNCILILVRNENIF